MRKRLRLLLVSLVAIAVGTVGVLIGRTLWLQYQDTLLLKGIEMLPGVVQRIQNFRRVKVVDNRKVWEVAAEDAQYYEAEKMVLIERAAVQLFFDDGRTIGLEGKQGRIYLEGKDVSRVELNGGIRATMADYKVQADNAIYDQATESISVPGTVQIHAAGIDLSGEGMEIDVAAKKFRLLRQVSMHIEPGALDNGGGNHAPL